VGLLRGCCGSEAVGDGDLASLVIHMVVVSTGFWHPGSVFALQLILFLLIHLLRAAPCFAKRHLQAAPAMGFLQESVWSGLFLSNMLLLSQVMGWSIPKPVPWT